MTLKPDTQLSYPCLNVNMFGSVKDPTPTLSNLEKNSGTCSFVVHAHTENEDVQRLIEAGKACYYLELDCSATFVRMGWKSQTGEIKVTIAGEDYARDVVGSVSVIAVERIEHYKNEAFDEFYQGFDITIEKGEVLVALGSFRWNSDKGEFGESNERDDLVTVVKGDEQQKFVKFELKVEKVCVSLPPQQYAAYDSPKIGRSERYAPMFHVAFLLPILEHALREIKSYSENRWAKALQNRIESELDLRTIALDGHDGSPFSDDGGLRYPGTIPDLAQAILKDPYARMINSMMVETENEN